MATDPRSIHPATATGIAARTRRAGSSPPHRTMTKSEQMSLVRTSGTSAEMQLRRGLWAAGLRYRLNGELPGSPDLFFPGSRLAVFIDGCFWHGCSIHYRAPRTNPDFWAAKLEANRARDRRADRVLRMMSWVPARIWEHELRQDLDGVVRVLARYVREQSRRSRQRAPAADRDVT